MILHGRSLEATEWLYNLLREAYDKKILDANQINNAIHAWLPGVKSIIPPDYCNDFNAAKLALPIANSTQPFWYQIRCEALNAQGYVWHPDYCDRIIHKVVYHFTDALALVTASVSTTLIYLQEEQRKKELEKENR